MTYEYKVVPAPTKGVKARGVRAGVDRFAYALETKMNELAADGWEYQRTDTLPCEEREGLMGKTTTFQNMLVFRRMVVAADDATSLDAAPIALPAPEPEFEPEPALETQAPMPDIADKVDLAEADAPTEQDADTSKTAAA